MRQHAMERSSLKAVGPFCAADGSMPLPVHVVIGNAGAELCWNVAPKTPNHFEVCLLRCVLQAELLHPNRRQRPCRQCTWLLLLYCAR